RIFSLKGKEEIEAIEVEHATAPHLRALQKALAKEITVRVHSEDDYNTAVNASEILFGNATADALKALDEKLILNVFEGVPQFEISKDQLSAGIPVIDLLAEKTQVFPSKGEARKMLQAGGVALNK
ncbi:MAG: tyrosine--tRNA ligase, partial [Candidatus Fonsibacter sp.]